MMRWASDGVGREQLTCRQVVVPTPGPREVLVRVDAVALNYRDKMVLESGRGLPLRFPFTPGSDLAGEVISVGPATTRFGPGARVISTFTPDWIDGVRPGTAREPAYRTLGGYYPGVLAEYVVLSEEWCVRAPASLSALQACTLPCAGLTAWFALVERARIKTGDTVLIPSTGGVAIFGLQIAKASGAMAIVSGRAEHEARVRALGADHYIERDRADWLDELYRLTDDRGADHVLEVVGGAHLARSVQAAAVGGHICQIGALAGFEMSAPAMPLMLKDVTIHGIGTGSRRALERFVRAVEQTGIAPVIDSVFSFDALPAALARLDQGAFGKIVVQVSA